MTPVDYVDANSSKVLKVEVWSDQLGSFSVSLNISGTYHLFVQDKNGRTIFDEDLTANCAMVISGTVILMPPDVLEYPVPNDDFATATKMDLPMPKFMGPPVQLGFANLSLDDRNGGEDKDYFEVSYQSSIQDDKSGGGGIVRHSLGMVMQFYPPSLDIQISTLKKSCEDLPFSWLLNIYLSDAYGRKVFATTNGGFHIECPTVKFVDKKLFAEISNPDYFSQGPVEYDIQFRYTPFKAILRCGAGLTKAEFVHLKKYYDKIWLGNPPLDSAGNRVDAEAWMHGSAIVISDVKGFLNKHQEFMSRPDILKSLQKTMGQPPNAIMATELLSLAQIARTGGLLGEAEKLYEESASKSSQTRRSDTQAEALRGLLGLYVAEGKSAKAKSVEKSLAALLKKSLLR